MASPAGTGKEGGARGSASQPRGSGAFAGRKFHSYRKKGPQGIS